MLFFTKICDKEISKSNVCVKLVNWQRQESQDLSNVAKQYDALCYQLYKRSQILNQLMDTCRRNEHNTNDLLLAADCLLVKEWSSVLAVYSTSGKTLKDLPGQQWPFSIALTRNDTYIYRCVSQKVEFLSECSLNLAKQENQTWNQTVRSWKQIKHELIEHTSNFIAPTSYPTHAVTFNPTKKPRKFDCCTIV